MARKSVKRSGKVRTLDRVPADLRDDVTGIPGYDPCRDAGDCYFDPEIARTVLDFFRECLTHVEGKWAGDPFDPLPWQRAILVNLFGWRRADGTRRYRELFLYIPRKNGKTTFCAGLMLVLFIGDPEIGAQLFAAAADEEQARILFDKCKAMIENDGWLSDQLDVMVKEIRRSETGSVFRVIDSKASTKHGGSASAAAVDEIHAHKNSELYDVIETSTAAKTQPMMIGMTTADYDRPSFANTKLKEAKDIVAGLIDDNAFLPVLFEADPDDDWTDPEIWKKANPSLDLTLNRDYLRRYCEKAKRSPAIAAVFRRLHLNVRTSESNSWINLEDWDACRGTISAESLAGSRCIGGLDLGSSGDLSALALAFPMADSRFGLLSIVWVPKRRVREQTVSEGVDYTDWIEGKFMRQTDGDATDYAVIRRDINELRERYGLNSIAIDRLFNAQQLSMELASDGFDMVMHGQGFMDMGIPTREFAELVLARRVVHDGSPVLRWMIGNTVVDQDPAGNLKPNKRRSPAKIDGVVASIMALGLAVVSDGEGTSIYDDREPRELTA